MGGTAKPVQRLLGAAIVIAVLTGCSAGSPTLQPTATKSSTAGEITLAAPDRGSAYDCGPTGGFSGDRLPNFCGQPYDAAYAYVADRAAIDMGLSMNNNGAGQDDYNIVCGQRPKAGTKVKPGMTLVLDVGGC